MLILSKLIEIEIYWQNIKTQGDYSELFAENNKSSFDYLDVQSGGLIFSVSFWSVEFWDLVGLFCC